MVDEILALGDKVEITFPEKLRMKLLQKIGGDVQTNMSGCNCFLFAHKNTSLCYKYAMQM